MWGKNINLDQAYDWVEFTLSNGETNYDVKANQSNLFSKVLLARSCVVWTTRNITLRFNSTNFAAIKLDAGESPAEFMNKINISNIYLTNASGSDSTVRIWLLH